MEKTTRNKALTPPYSTLLIIWLLFLSSLGTDTLSTLLVLNNMDQVFELSPAISNPEETQLSAFLIIDLLFFLIITFIFFVFYQLPHVSAKKPSIRMIFKNLSLVVFLLAVSKLWFSIENISLFIFGNNLAQTVQFFLEEFGLVDIHSRSRAMILSSSIALTIAFILSRIFFSKFPLYPDNCTKKSPKQSHEDTH